MYGFLDQVSGKNSKIFWPCLRLTFDPISVQKYALLATAQIDFFLKERKKDMGYGSFLRINELLAEGSE
jgi:hypothetical protein